MRFNYFLQGHLCNSRTRFIHDLLWFGKEVKVFLYAFKLIDKITFLFIIQFIKQQKV